MKDLTISLPDEIYDSVVNLLQQIPNVILNEDDAIFQNDIKLFQTVDMLNFWKIPTTVTLSQS